MEICLSVPQSGQLLDQICISFDEGKTTMNFTEAALLIQGSACVYSKKVEYLYSLVYQALDFISGKKRAKQLSSAREDGADGDGSSRAPREEDEFLLLDDLPESRTNVDLRGDQAPSDTLIVPLLPMALVAPDEMEKNSNPLYRSLAPVLSVSQEPGTSLEGPVPGYRDDEEDAEGAAVLPEAVAPEVPMEPQEPRSPEQGITRPRKCLLREPASRLKETPDPWQGLDPFDSLDSKPFRKGRPYSVPPCVEAAPGQKRKRKGTAKLQDFHQWYLAAYADHADSRSPRRKGPSFADMEDLYWRHVKEQLETLRKLQRREASDFLEPEEYAEPEGAKPEEDGDLEAEAMPASLSYEELVRRNVELFITTSQKFVQETELSQRIREWEDTIQPLLQEQEQHMPFDIHTYGDQVVSRFRQLNQWCPFAELVAGQPAFEVCRSMLASLQLANDHTVEITQQPGLEAAVDTMSLRLLTYQRAHKRFQTYAAPSMAQP
ncbi:condensin-2 complex subunit H2 [Camelus ferus]|nr:condensin-2 complex subunit H2 [Camelus ferus]